MPTGGAWTPAKQEASAYVQSAGTSSPSPVLRGYIRAHGGASAMATRGTGSSRGSGGAHGGSASGSTEAARRVAQNWGGFLGQVASVGFEGALRGWGLDALIGKGPTEIATGLLDALSEPGSTLDQAAARGALSELIKDVLKDAQNYEEVSTLLSASVDGIGLHEMVSRFFGNYVFELFARDFYEDWQAKVGPSKAENALTSIKNCIHSAVHAKLQGQDLRTMDWRGAPGEKLAQQVMHDVLYIFEVLP